MRPLILVTICYATCSIALSSTTPKGPASVPGSSRLAVELTAPVRRDSWLPLKLSFSSDEDAPRHCRNVDFLFEVLDENGRQLVGAHGASIFTGDSVIRDVDLSEKMVVYKPKLMIDKYVDILVAGHKYQLIVVLPKMGLIGAVWFTFE